MEKGEEGGDGKYREKEGKHIEKGVEGNSVKKGGKDGNENKS